MGNGGQPGEAMPVSFSINRFEFPRSLTAHSEVPQPLQKTLVYALSVQERHGGLFCEAEAAMTDPASNTQVQWQVLRLWNIFPSSFRLPGSSPLLSLCWTGW